MIEVLEQRFNKNMARHQAMAWSAVRARLEGNPDKLAVLAEMERTGGEPDVVGVEPSTGELVFCDCSPESPAGRRSLCFDRAALDARKENKPSGSAQEVAKQMGVALLTEAEYRHLQTLGEFDRKTSSWVQNPPTISASRAAPCSATAAMATFSCTTTAPSHIMRRAASAASSGFKAPGSAPASASSRRCRAAWE